MLKFVPYRLLVPRCILTSVAVISMAFVLEGDFVTVEACFEGVFCHLDINLET